MDILGFKRTAILPSLLFKYYQYGKQKIKSQLSDSEPRCTEGSVILHEEDIKYIRIPFKHRVGRQRVLYGARYKFKRAI
jgi:hypothetical protein